jgi:hypothetical protein
MCGGSSWVPDPISIIEEVVSPITDPVSDLLGTSGNDGGLLGLVDDAGNFIDENITQPIGGGLADVDQFVNREVPGGWKLPAAIAAAYATGYVDPELFASEYGTEIATEQGQNAFFEALANGASSEEALQAGSAMDSLLSTNAGLDLTDLSSQELTDFAESVKDVPGFTPDEAGNIVQTFDDGSTITLDSAGNVISTTEAPMDPINWQDALNNPVTKKLGSTLANKAMNSILAPATKAIAGKTGFKPVGQGGLSMTNQTGAGSNDSINTQTGFLTPGLSMGNPNYTLGNAPLTTDLYNVPTNPSLNAPQKFAMGGYAMGGQYQEHNPSFYSEGGMENRYVQGDGDGTSDDVAAMLANGEFVIPADIVAALGNGSNDAGAHVLDQFLSVVREDNHSNAPDELPPKSKGPLDYLAQARKRA